MQCIKDPLVLIALALGLNLMLAAWQLVVIVKFMKLLAVASQGAADHFEKLRKVRQVGM